MKFKQIVFALLAVVLISAASCKKDDSPFTDSLSNTSWKGFVDGVDIILAFGTDTKIDVNIPDVGTFKGTYTFSNNILLFSMVKSNNDTEKYSFTGTLSGNTINGTYGIKEKTSGGGTFTVTKQ